MRSLDPSELRGRITAVPVVNMPTFRERTAFVSPQDGKNLNRCFPGDPDGTFSDVLAHAVFERLMPRPTCSSTWAKLLSGHARRSQEGGGDTTLASQPRGDMRE